MRTAAGTADHFVAQEALSELTKLGPLHHRSECGRPSARGRADGNSSIRCLARPWPGN